MGKLGNLLALAFWLASSAPASAEIIAGLTGGVVIPGDQDLAFKEYGTTTESIIVPSFVDRTNHVQPRRVDTDNVNEYIGPFVSANVTAWGEWSLLRYFALQLEAMYWHVDVKPGKPVAPAPQFTIGEHRTGILVNALGRLPLYPSFGRPASEKGSDTFAYLGAGAGAVYSSVTHGSQTWGRGYQLLGGISVPIGSHLRLRIEGRYLLTGDVDTSTRDKLAGWKVDTSGTPTKLRRNETEDTRFFPIALGLDWRF